MCTEDGTGGRKPCSPCKKAAKAIVEKFEAKVRRRAQRLTASRTGRMVPLDKIHEDQFSCDAYQRLMEVILRAARDWKPDGGMTLEAWTGFRLAHTDADASFFSTPLTVTYGAAQDYIAAAGSSHDLDIQRDAWEARGRDPLDFDTIAASQSFDQPTLPGDWSVYHDDTEQEQVDPPCARPSTEVLAEAQLFLTRDLTEVEQMVLLFHDRDGYTFKEIGRDMLPDHLFDHSGNYEHKARRIYLKARTKAADFRKLDGSSL